jgi:hypothetical protein
MIEKILEFYSPFGLVGKYLFENKVARIITIIIFVASCLGSIGIGVYVTVSGLDKPDKEHLINGVLPFLLVPGILIAMCFVFYSAAKTPDKFDLQLERLRNERKEITQKIEKEKEPDIFHTIQLSLNQLNEYYTINKGQARSSFQFSIFSIVIGLITILTGIWIVYIGHSGIQVAFISGASGLLLEFIGGAYFFMYKKSLEQVNFFFVQLIKIQDTMLAINLAKNIVNEPKKEEMHEKIISSLLERSLK